MHLTYEQINDDGDIRKFKKDIDLDGAFFYSIPTSFFVVDSRIPEILRDLITEAEGCRRMNYLVGASACTRKAIYEFLALQHASGQHYDDKIADLRTKHPLLDPVLFEPLGHIKDMTSDHLHEQSWVVWDSANVQLFLETLKALLHEFYVVPAERQARVGSIRVLRDDLGQAGAMVDSSDDQNTKD